MSTDTPYQNGLLSVYLETVRLKQAAKHIREGQSVLDLGCNEGQLLDHVTVSIRYTGVDISEYAIQKARQKHPEHEFVVADLTQDLQLEEKKYDAIILLAFLEHIQRPQELVQHIARYLKPAGRLIVTTPAPYGRKLHDFGAKIGLFSSKAAEEHEKMLGEAELREIANFSELKVVRFERFLVGFNQLAIYSYA